MVQTLQKSQRSRCRSTPSASLAFQKGPDLRNSILVMSKSLPGRVRYGDKYFSYDELVAQHLSASAHSCDRGHLGPAFATYHRALALRFEEATGKIHFADTHQTKQLIDRFWRPWGALFGETMFGKCRCFLCVVRMLQNCWVFC
eukprot:5463662-Amphidinium_carterae.1